MSDSSGSRPSVPPALLDSVRYPREFSFSLVCSLVLHLAIAGVLLQQARFPSIETVRDVFLTPDWTVAPVSPDPRMGGAGPPELPPRRSPAPRAIAAPPTPAPPKVARGERPAKSEPAPAPAPAPTPTTGPSVAPDSTAPVKPQEVVSAPAVAPDAAAPPLPPRGTSIARLEQPAPPLPPLPPREIPVAPPAPPIVPAPAPVQAPPPVVQPAAPRVPEVAPPTPAPPAPELAPQAPVELPAPTAPQPGPVQAPIAVAQPPAPPTIEERPLPPPSEWKDAQPLVPAPTLPSVPAPIAVPVAPPSPSLGLPQPQPAQPAVAAVTPAPPLQAPLDWEVPAAQERDFSSVGRVKEGNTAAMTPAAPLTPITAPKVNERATAKPAPTPPAPSDRTAPGTSDRATAPQQSAESRLSLGTGADLSSPGLSAHRAGERAAVAATRDKVGTGLGVSQGTAKDVATPLAGTAVAPPTTEGRGVAPSGVAEIGAPLGGVGETRGAAPAGTSDKAAGAPGAAGDQSVGLPGGTADRIAGAPSGTGDVTVGGATGDVRSDTGTGTGGSAVTEGGGPPSQGRVGGRGPGGVAITTPQNGYRLSPDDPPIVIVRGQVEDPEISTVVLLVNSRRVEVRVRDGKFYYPLVVVDPTMKITAEVTTSATRRSEAIVIHGAPNPVTTGVVLLDWGEVKPGGAIDMSATWRPRADRVDGQPTKLFVKQAPMPDDIPVTAFYLRNMQSGVYTFSLGYRGLGGGTPFVPKFYLTTPGVPTAREMKGLTLAGSGRLPAVRVLLPQAVTWDQDEWFTGRSEGSDTVTKFRDDGTTWIELKGR